MYVLYVSILFTCMVTSYYLSDIVRIEKVQRFFTKRIVSLRSVPYDKRLDVFKPHSLEYHPMILLYYKILNGKLDTDSSNVFTLNSNSRTRGRAFKLLNWINWKKHLTWTWYIRCRPIFVLTYVKQSCIPQMNHAIRKPNINTSRGLGHKRTANPSPTILLLNAWPSRDNCSRIPKQPPTSKNTGMYLLHGHLYTYADPATCSNN